ncbi:hypothetical protein D9M70_638380 [compost metagenome]
MWALQLYWSLLCRCCSPGATARTLKKETMFPSCRSSLPFRQQPWRSSYSVPLKQAVSRSSRFLAHESDMTKGMQHCC